MKLTDIKSKTEPILRKYGVIFAGVFGSAARGEARSDSDTDLLVKFEKAPSLVQFIRMENELKEALGTDVDVVVQGSEKRLIKPAIEKDLVPVYGQG